MLHKPYRELNSIQIGSLNICFYSVWDNTDNEDITVVTESTCGQMVNLRPDENNYQIWLINLSFKASAVMPLVFRSSVYFKVMRCKYNQGLMRCLWISPANMEKAGFCCCSVSTWKHTHTTHTHTYQKNYNICQESSKGWTCLSDIYCLEISVLTSALFIRQSRTDDGRRCSEFTIKNSVIWMLGP